MKRLLENGFALSGIGLVASSREVVMMEFMTPDHKRFHMAIDIDKEKISYTGLIEGSIEDKGTMLVKLAITPFKEITMPHDALLVTALASMFLKEEAKKVTSALKKIIDVLGRKLAADINEQDQQSEINDLLNEIGIN